MLLLTSELPPHVVGGLGTVAHEHARRLAAAPDVRLTVAAPYPGRRPRREARRAAAGESGSPPPRGTWHVLWIPDRPPYVGSGAFAPRAVLGLLRAASRARPDVVLAHSPDAAHVVTRLRARAGVPVVYFCHSLVTHEQRSGRARPWQKASLRRQEALLAAADVVVVPSAAARHAVERCYPRVAARVRVIPHGIHRPGRVDGRRGRRIVFAGRLHHVKGVETLIRALPPLLRRVPSAVVEVYGTASVRQRRRLRRLARRVGVAHRLRWRGWVSRQALGRAYRRAGVVAVPSRWESFGLVALDALAHAAPLVCSDAGALRAIPDDVAYKVRPRDPAALARAIARALRSRREAQERALRGRLWVERFDWERSAAQVLDILRQIAGEGAR